MLFPGKTYDPQVTGLLQYITLFVWLISHQPAVLFSQNKPGITNQPAVLFSQNKPAPAERTGCISITTSPFRYI
jgi:hypothetical protein